MKKLVEDTPEQAAESISAALDFLQAEAEAAGLCDLGALIRQASTRAKERSAPMSPAKRTGDATDLRPTGNAVKVRVTRRFQLIRTFLRTKLVR
ncbi:MAG TPA: hypothetical protein VNQ14_03350 [Woeseiaceae bacterium]|nr:hypothetical protein [Woeseiaceae bacterium]